MELVGTGLKSMFLAEPFPFYNNVCYQCKRKEQFPKYLCDSQMQYNIFLATSFVVREELSLAPLLHYSGTKQFTPFKRD